MSIKEWPTNDYLVIVESPFAGDRVRNILYARACIKDCLERGEYPFASHLLYTQPGILDDNDPNERQQGIDAGLAWMVVAAKTVVYLDLGLSTGMKYGIENASKYGKPIEFRNLDPEKVPPPSEESEDVLDLMRKGKL